MQTERKKSKAMPKTPFEIESLERTLNQESSYQVRSLTHRFSNRGLTEWRLRFLATPDADSGYEAEITKISGSQSYQINVHPVAKEIIDEGETYFPSSQTSETDQGCQEVYKHLLELKIFYPNAPLPFAGTMEKRNQLLR